MGTFHTSFSTTTPDFLYCPANAKPAFLGFDRFSLVGSASTQWSTEFMQTIKAAGIPHPLNNVGAKALAADWLTGESEGGQNSTSPQSSPTQ